MVTTSGVCVHYASYLAIEDFDHCFEAGKIHTIIGPNGSGKSTVFKAIARLVRHSAGGIEIDGKQLHHYPAKQLAKKLGILSQSNLAPSDFTVRDLLRFGRTPHKKRFEVMTNEDEEIIDWAIEMTHLEALQHRAICCLSGGERQRAWIAMNLAQQPTILLLDEPTTYLDIQHQFEVMELIKRLNRTLNITVVMILHDLNQASLYSDTIVVLKDGKIVSKGTPEEVMQPQLIKEVYQVHVEIGTHASGKPMVIPVGL